MRKLCLFLVLTGAMAILSMSPLKTTTDLQPCINKITALYRHHALSLDSFLRQYPQYFYDSSAAIRELKYEELAWYFKHTAGLIIYFEPAVYYKKLVGPFQFAPGGKPGFFGLLPDAWLFLGPIGNETDSALRTFTKQDSADQIGFIGDAVTRYREALHSTSLETHLASIDGPVLFDLLRMEMFRISTIDIANGDFIIDEAALPSLKGSLDAWLLATQQLTQTLPPSQTVLRDQWDSLSAGVRHFIDQYHSYTTVDRMKLTRQYLIPLSVWLSAVQQYLEVPRIGRETAIRRDATSIYQENVFNPDHFAPGAAGAYTPEKAALGRLLFFDPILSDNNRRACASCHKPELAFTDGRMKSMAFDSASLQRNSPTVINAGFQQKLFWDLRASSLEDQLDSVVNNANELHSSFKNVITRLNASPEYLTLFHKAFPGTRTRSITRADIKYAIGVYERTLTGMNSRFDKFMRGDDTRLSEEEVAGFNVYMGKAKCGVCHITPLFNGTLPPYYNITDHHSLGIPLEDTMVKYIVDPDTGFMKVTGDPFTRFSFKTPTIRNIDLTAPYMHNGVFQNLEQVVDFYDKAAGNTHYKDVQKDMKELPFFTILPIPLQLTPVEKRQLVAFMRTLTDSSATTQRPARLPVLTGPFARLNRRTIGGDY